VYRTHLGSITDRQLAFWIVTIFLACLGETVGRGFRMIRYVSLELVAIAVLTLVMFQMDSFVENVIAMPVPLVGFWAGTFLLRVASGQMKRAKDELRI